MSKRAEATPPPADDDETLQVNVNVSEFELPALSEAVKLITYVPLASAEIVVLRDVDVPKVIAPGPETFAH